MFTLLTLFFVIATIRAQDEIFLNPGFEEAFDGDDWYCFNDCNIVRDQDAYSGAYSGRVTNRFEQWHTMSQDVPLEPNTHYFFSTYIKVLSMESNSLWEIGKLQISLNLEGGGIQYLDVSLNKYLRVDQGWQKMAGDFYVRNQAVTSFRAFIQLNTSEEHTDYLVDEASLTAFYENGNWKNEANARIDQIRKNDVTLNVNIGGGYQPGDIEIEVNQISQSFPFGSTINDVEIAGDTDANKLYQDTFYGHYNWAVMENALKWKQMEPTKDDITFPDKSILRLNERGIPLRGHNVFWGVEERVPDWLLNMSPVEVEAEIQRRIDYVVSRYAGLLIHWDVNNELEHGPWFETKLSNPTYMNNMFTDIRARDENVLLFLNDFEVISNGVVMQSYLNKAIEVQTATGEVGGIGVQSHLSGIPDITALQKRLDVITSIGFRVWITELDIAIENRDQRAQAYDDVVTLYYSYPEVDGILMWGFSEIHHWKPNCALFEGEQLEPNAAGIRWHEMMFERWRSYETFLPVSDQETFGFRGFHGGYEIQVTHNGQEILTQQFDLQPGVDASVDLDIN